MKALEKWYIKNGMGQPAPTTDLDEQKNSNQPTRTKSFQPWDGDLLDDDDAYQADERLQR